MLFHCRLVAGKSFVRNWDGVSRAALRENPALLSDLEIKVK